MANPQRIGSADSGNPESWSEHSGAGVVPQ
jgi:hypothetical protein